MSELCFLLLLSTVGLINCETAREMPSTLPVEEVIVVEDMVEVAKQNSQYVWLKFKNLNKEARVVNFWWDGSYQGWHKLDKNLIMPRGKKSAVSVQYHLHDKDRKPIGQKKSVNLRLKGGY